MSPIEQARLVYFREPCARTFVADLEMHLQHGYVVSTPDCFAMARPVWRDWAYRHLANPEMTAPGGDCWWIWILAGDMKTALWWLPEKKPWIGYERKNEPRFFSADRFPLQFQGNLG